MPQSFSARLQLSKDTIGLAFIISHFMARVSIKDQKAALANVKNIENFMWKTKAGSIEINWRQEFHYSCELAQQLAAATEFPFSVDKELLIRLWTKVTDLFVSEDNWTALKMSICTSAQLRSEELDKITSESGEQSYVEFISRLQSEDAEIETRINDPNYWRQIIADMQSGPHL